MDNLSFPRACPVCEVGIMKTLNYMLTSNPPKQPYQCTNCNHVYTETIGVAMNVGQIGVSDE